MNFSERIVVSTISVPWIASPEPGVDRRPLERDGGEVAHATSIVRYRGNSQFPKHEHPMGEEFLVLDGVFSDEHGEYEAGTYVRNPWRTGHAPYSREGCILFVKLRQIDEKDSRRVVLHPRNLAWQSTRTNEVTQKVLHLFENEQVTLERWSPSAHGERHTHERGEEILVLDGTFADEEGSYPQWTWMRLPPQSSHTPYTQTGCLLWVKRGHLR